MASRQGGILFVQTFAAGRLEPGAEAGAATLTLEQPAGQTVYFSERPGRSVGTMPLPQFLAELERAAADPLNAALVIEGPAPDQDQLVVVELRGGTAGTAEAVTYDVRLLSDPAALDLDPARSPGQLTEVTEPLAFGASHLFIDAALYQA